MSDTKTHESKHQVFELLPKVAAYPLPSLTHEIDLKKVPALLLQALTTDDIEFFITRPWWTKQCATLQKHLSSLVPNTHVVADPEQVISSICAMLITTKTESQFIKVVLNNNDILLAKGKVNDCHHNVDKLLRSKKIDRWMIGFALSDDSRWRHHSWGMQNDGTIIETTCKRLVYCGVDINRFVTTYRG